MDIKYFKDIDNDAIYACVGPMAVNALFRLRLPLAKDGQWEFLVPNSPAWDGIHQRIYRNPRVEEVRPEEFPVPLPPLPEAPRGPFPQWKEWERLHLRPMAIKLEHAAFVAPDFNPQLFDHYKVEEVLAALEARLRG